MKSATNDPVEGSVTYDSRITLVSGFNDYFIESLRERGYDAHFCVAPADIVLFEAGNPDVDPRLDVEVIG